MKHTRALLICCIAICCTGSLHAQYFAAPAPPSYSIVSLPGATLSRVIDTMYAHANPTDSSEGGELEQIAEFRTFWEGRVIANDSSGTDMFTQYYAAMKTAATARTTGAACTSSGFAGNWQSIGVTNLPNQVEGYITSIWANPADSNEILAGTQGGLFKTTNGGINWSCITDNTVLAGGTLFITCIAVNPLDTNTIFIGSNGGGLLKSFDGGATWQQEDISGGNGVVNRIFFTPDGIRIYAVTNNTLYTRLSADGSSWADITPSISANFTDLQFVPGNRSHFFISSTGADAGIWETTDSLAATGWTLVTSGFSATVAGIFTAATDWVAMDISVPGNDTLYFIAMDNIVSNAPFAYAHAALYKRNISGSTHSITEIYDDLPHSNNPSGGKFQLIVSPANTNNMYYASDIPSQAYDRTNGFIPIGTYGVAGDVALPTHGDIRGIYLQHSTSAANGVGDRLYLATDGGASLKPTGIAPAVSGYFSTINISGTGLNCGTYFGFSTYEADVSVGGMMHDGIVSYQPSLAQPWSSLFVADSWECDVDKSSPKNAYTWSQYNEFSKTAPDGDRDMDEVNDIVQPADPGYPGVGKPTATDAYGSIYTAGNDFWRKMPSDAAFFDMNTYMGFPSTLASSNPNYGAYIALNPDDTTFEGYVVFGTNDNTVQHIFYRNFGIPLYRTAQEISLPNGAAAYHCYGITTNRYNTGQVWVCLGGSDDNGYSSALYRVEYSPDHGTTWVDISNGLPSSVAVASILYDEAAKTLYASTDVGNFKCDFSVFDPSATYSYAPLGININTSVLWTCFNQGAVSGQDYPNLSGILSINHCQGKLYSATFGRAVWSTDIYPSTTTIPDLVDTITTTTTWTNANQYITGSIYIKAGGTLNITANDTVHMPKNGAIIVDPGGKLNVSQSMITNDCSQCFWQGISALNSSGGAQSAAHCGWVSITGGSTIQHAVIGVANYNTITPIVNPQNGGVIQAIGSYFTDNQNDVSITDFSNHTATGLPTADLSYFQSCTFLLDNNYKGDALHIPMTYMVNLTQTDGVFFSGCQFLNRDTAAFSRSMGEGIHCMDASCQVLSYHGGPSSPFTFANPEHSRFCGFNNGVEISGVSGADLTTSIDLSDFDTVGTGVFVSTYNNVSVTQCTFVVGNGLGQEVLPNFISSGETFLGCYQNMGIYNQNSFLFRIENNIFRGSPATHPTEWYNLGTVVDNDWLGISALPSPVPALSNTVYRNTFDSLSQGICALGCNGVLIPMNQSLGTQISCNVFNTNGTDILVANDGVGSYYQGIAPNQGTISVPAGNIFSGSINNIVDAGSGITYYYNPAVVDSKPLVVTTPEVALYTTSASNGCPSTFIGTVGNVLYSTTTMSAVSASFSVLRKAVNDSTTAYGGLIDGGSTDGLLDAVYAATDSSSLYKVLSPVSPWLSIAALEDVADLQMLPYTTMLTLLRRNPDPLRSPDFINYMLTDYAFTANDLDTLATASDSVTRRTILESSMATNTAVMSTDANIILMSVKAPMDTAIDPTDTTLAGICTDSTSIYYTLDSNATYFGLDSVDAWLQNIGGDWSLYARIGFYNGTQQFSTADSLYNALPDLLSTKYYPDQYSSFTDLWGVITRQVETIGGSGLFRVDQLSLSPDLVPAPTGYSSGPITGNIAMQMINNINIYNIHTIPTIQVCFYPVLSGLRKSHKIPIEPPGYGITNVNDNGGAAQLSAAPNPVSNTVTFSWSVSGGAGNINITITNAFGEVVAVLTSATSQGKMAWNASAMPPGIYIYQASDSNGIIKTGKLVVVK